MNILRCRFCETLFESDVADRGREEEPCCPQCGLTDTEPATAAEDDFVVCSSTAFR
jgi:hypothetical protein